MRIVGKETKFTELRERIAEWLRMPRDYSSGRLVLRGFLGGFTGSSKLEKLCKWIRDEGYSKKEVKKVLKKYKNSYPGRDEGLLRDAGGESKFKNRKRELLARL